MADPRKNAPRSRAKKKSGESPDGPTTRTVFSLSEEETLDLGRCMARNLRGGELIVLEGELGLGKTVFARGIAEGLGLPSDDVSSPKAISSCRCARCRRSWCSIPMRGPWSGFGAGSSVANTTRRSSRTAT